MAEESFTVVCRYDEAIDAEAMTSDERDHYRETGDMSALKFLDGERPALWHCRRLRTSEMREVYAAPNDSARYEAAFARGLVKVENMRVGDSRQTLGRPSDKPLNDKALDMYDPADVLEVGAAIYGRSILGKGRPAAWPLPATSRLAVAALVYRRVARAQTSAASSATNRPPAVEAVEAPPSRASAMSGAATAMESSAASPGT